MKPIFVSMSLGGIANRIKTLASCQRLAEKYNGDVLLYWPKTKTCFASFKDLFQNDIKQISKDELRVILKSINKRYHDDSQNIFYKNDKKYQIFSGWKIIFSEDDVNLIKNKKIDLSFSKLPKQIHNEYLKQFKKLKPQEDILQKIDVFNKKNSIKKYIGVHIRRGDFLESSSNLTSVSPDKSFIHEIDVFLKNNPEHKVLICTDSKSTENKIIKKFGSKIIKFDKAKFDKFDIDFVKSGLVDMLLLSKSEKIFASYHSTFSECAWWLGGCSQDVTVVEDKKAKIRYLKNKRNVRRGMVSRIKAFIFETITPLHKRLIPNSIS